MHKIYLDNLSTTRPSEQSIAKSLPFLREKWGVSFQPHQMGQELYRPIDEALKEIYNLIGATAKDDFVFTSSGAEAITQVFYSVYHDVTRVTGKNQFITSNCEEAPSLMAINRMEEMTSVGKMAKVDVSGKVLVSTIEDLITPRTALVSLSWANGLTGVLNPVAEIATLCQERGVLFHLDATHVLGKLFYQLEDIKPDFLTFNGDHLHAPKGTGGLFIRYGVKCSNLIVGGFDQGGKRAGSYSVANLVALGVAAKEMKEARDYVCTEIARLRDLLETNLEQIPDVKIYFKEVERLPNTVIASFQGVSNEALLYALNKKGVYASMGGGNFQQIALMLNAVNIEEQECLSALNFTLSRETTEEEIMKATQIIKECVETLRKLSRQL